MNTLITKYLHLNNQVFIRSKCWRNIHIFEYVKNRNPEILIRKPVKIHE